MNLPLSRCNLVCYGSEDNNVFRLPSGIGTFTKWRMFESTEPHLKLKYQEDIKSLSQLPTLFVTECFPDSKINKPAFLSRIEDVHEDGDEVVFRFQHINDQLTSQRVFDCGFFHHKTAERYRTHWAVKEGDLLEKALGFLGTFPTPKRPIFFSSTDWPLPILDHVAVMMPFEKEFDATFATIRSTCEHLEVSALRVDEIYGPNRIIDDIFRTITQSKLVIADLTGRNPNVLYESGLAHAQNRDVIIITQDHKDVPFNLKQYRFLKYLPNEEGLHDLKGKLTKSIQAALSGR